MTTVHVRRALLDIRTWLLIVFIVRLWGITAPPLENTHSWRQAFTNMVARNMAEGSIDLLHPRTDLAGERPDVVSSEFPAFNAIIAVMHRLFGRAHWYGRLIALVFSTLGVWAFHNFMRSRSDVRTAFLASFVFLWSAWFIYGRKSMPDTFSVSLVIIALFAVDRAVDRLSWPWLIAAVGCAALGGLCKIPAVVLLAPWGLLVFDRSILPLWRASVGIALVIAVVPVVWWYFHWQPHLLATYGNELYFPYSLRDGFHGIMEHKWKLLERFTYSALMSHVAFVALLVGTYFAVLERKRGLLLCIVCIAVPFGYFMLKAGSVFPLHAYYILPLVPLLCALAGAGLARLPTGAWTTAALSLLVVESMGPRWSDLNGGAERAYLLRAEGLADACTGSDDLVATNSILDPRTMYYLHRHGWNMDHTQLNEATLDSLHHLGLKAVFVDRHVNDSPLPWPVHHEDEDWRIHVPPDDLN